MGERLAGDPSSLRASVVALLRSYAGRDAGQAALPPSPRLWRTSALPFLLDVFRLRGQTLARVVFRFETAAIAELDYLVTQVKAQARLHLRAA